MSQLDARTEELRTQLVADEADLTAKTAQLGEAAADGDNKLLAQLEKQVDQLRSLIARAHQGLLVLGRRRQQLETDLAASRLEDAHAELAALEAETLTLWPALAGAVDDMIDVWNELHQVAQRSNKIAHDYPQDIAPTWSGYASRPPDWWDQLLVWRKDLQRRMELTQGEPPAPRGLKVAK